MQFFEVFVLYTNEIEINIMFQLIKRFCFYNCYIKYCELHKHVYVYVVFAIPDDVQLEKWNGGPNKSICWFYALKLLLWKHAYLSQTENISTHE